MEPSLRSRHTRGIVPGDRLIGHEIPRTPHRRPAARLAAAHPQRKCRAAHLPHAAQSLRQRRARRSRPCPILPGAAARRGRCGSARARKPSASSRRRARLGVAFVALGEADYPAQLARPSTTPRRCSRCAASRGAAISPMVAMVGSRNASAAGVKFAEQLARDLGAAGFVVVSGLARGIDAAAHRASLATGDGRGARRRPRPRLSARARAAGGGADRRPAPRCPKCRSAGSRAAAIFRAATA